MSRTDRLLLFGAVAAGAGGLAISGYLTAAHYSGAPLACVQGEEAAGEEEIGAMN